MSNDRWTDMVAGAITTWMVNLLYPAALSTLPSPSTAATTMELIDATDPKPTPMIPCLDGVKRTLVKALKQDESYYEITEHFQEIIDKITNLPADSSTSLFVMARLTKVPSAINGGGDAPENTIMD